MTPLFVSLVEYLTLDEAQATAWWTALTRARWTPSQSWRCELVYFDAQPGGVEKLDAVVALLQTVAAPERLVEVLEALVQERLLTRKAATQIEDKVLLRMDRQGRWF